MCAQWKAQMAIAALGALLALSLGACDGGPTALGERTTIVADRPELVGVTDDDAKRSASGVPKRIVGQGKLSGDRRIERF